MAGSRYRPTSQPTTVASSTLRYFIGVVLVRTISFLMLPVYTRFLGPSEYGLLQLLQITTDVVGIAISAGTTSGVMRLYHKAPTTRDAHSVAFTALMLLALLNGTGAAVLMLFAKPIATTVLHGADFAGLVRLSALSFALDALITAPVAHMVADRAVSTYVRLTVAQTVANAVLNARGAHRVQNGCRGHGDSLDHHQAGIRGNRLLVDHTAQRVRLVGKCGEGTATLRRTVSGGHGCHICAGLW